RLRILELADLVLVGAADLRARLVVALLRRVALALGFLLEVRLLRARFLGDAAVLVGQELRVVVGLVLDVLVVLDLDHRHVRRWLLRRRLLLLLRRLLRRWRQWRRRLLLRIEQRDLRWLLLVELLGVDRRRRRWWRERLDQLVELRVGERDLDLLRL